MGLFIIWKGSRCNTRNHGVKIIYLREKELFLLWPIQFVRIQSLEISNLTETSFSTQATFRSSWIPKSWRDTIWRQRKRRSKLQVCIFQTFSSLVQYIERLQTTRTIQLLRWEERCWNQAKKKLSLCAHAVLRAWDLVISRYRFAENWKEMSKFSHCTWRAIVCSLNAGAPNDQFVVKCIIIPQLMKINVIKAFQVFFSVAGKTLSVLFSQQDTREISQPAR